MRTRFSHVSHRKMAYYAIALGYEDLNDHDGLRQDVALQTAVDWPVHRPYAVLRTGLIIATSTDDPVHNATVCILLTSMVPNTAGRFCVWPKVRIIFRGDGGFTRSATSSKNKRLNRLCRMSLRVDYRHYCFLPLYVAR